MRSVAAVLLACFALAACGQPSPTMEPTSVNGAAVQAPDPASRVERAAEPVIPAADTTGAGSCTAGIGAKAAQALAGQCRQVSPATRPPCNAANSCAAIRSEIQRSCDLFDGTERPAICAAPAAPTPTGLVQLYYALIDGRDYGPAYRLWDDDGRASRQTRQAFEAGFARTLSATVRTGAPSAPEGAAGSVYVTVPVTVEAIRDDRTRQRFSGSYVVRRSNISPDGAWRLYSAKLRAE